MISCTLIICCTLLITIIFLLSFSMYTAFVHPVDVHLMCCYSIILKCLAAIVFPAAFALLQLQKTFFFHLVRIDNATTTTLLFILSHIPTTYMHAMVCHLNKTTVVLITITSLYLAAWHRSSTVVFESWIVILMIQINKPNLSSFHGTSE